MLLFKNTIHEINIPIFAIQSVCLTVPNSSNSNSGYNSITLTITTQSDTYKISSPLTNLQEIRHSHRIKKPEVTTFLLNLKNGDSIPCNINDTHVYEMDKDNPSQYLEDRFRLIDTYNYINERIDEYERKIYDKF